MDNLDKKGVYKILNIINKKWYVGSVHTSTFRKRFKRHLKNLQYDSHENSNLQKSFNDYGEKNFKFEILEILKENILEREQYYITTFFEELFNIHPHAAKPPCFSESSKETRVKHQVSLTKFRKEAGVFYKKLKGNELSIDEIPHKYKRYVSSKFTFVAWNKGLTSKDFDYSFLKVKKTLTESFLTRAKNVGLEKRKKSKNINVYFHDGSLFKTFQSVSDIVDYSKQLHNDLVLVFKGSNTNPILEMNNILKVLHKKQPHHKGLIFRFFDDTSKVDPLTPKDIWWSFKSFNQCKFYKNCSILEKSNIGNPVNSGEVL